jgi:hypothetical protein
MAAITPTPSRPTELAYLDHHRVLLCLPCQRAVRPGAGAEDHLRSVHRWTGARLAGALAWIMTLALQDPHTVNLPPDGAPPIPQLAVQAGYRCLDCVYRTVNRKNMYKHGRQARHGRVGRGWAEAALQTFSQGRYTRYWVVEGPSGGRPTGSLDRPAARRDEDGAATTTTTTTAAAAAAAAAADDDDDNDDDGDDDTWARILDQHDATAAREREARRQVVENATRPEQESTWVREMGWARHLAGKDPGALYRASLMPTAARARAGRQDRAAPAQEQEDRLHRIGASFERVMGRCVRRLDRVPHETLRWINSFDPAKPAAEPFRVKEREASMRRYKGWWKRYLCYCVRAGRLGREAARQEQGVRFNEGQWAVLVEVIKQVDDPDQTTEPVEPDEWKAWAARLDEAVFRFCVGSLKQKVAFQVYVNPLLHFAAVLGFRGEAGAWKEAKDYTGQLAGLVWCGRALMLEHFFTDTPDDPEAIIEETVEGFLTGYRTWLADGAHTPFSTIIRWMAYGKGYRRREGGAPRLLWEADGTTVRYLGERLTVAAFQGAAQAGVAEAAELLDGLMFGGWRAVEDRLDLGRVVDSLMYEGEGVSFATNGRNDWLKPGPRMLAQRGRARLWTAGRGWRQSRVADYLGRVGRFRQAHLVNTHIWGGQPGRGPEITTLRSCDAAGLSRNIFVFDGQVMIVTDRDKSQAVRGIGRKVARFLPGRVGRMMVAFVAWIVPFEQMLQRQIARPEVGAGAGTEGFLWRDERKGVWKTAELSQGLASLIGRSAGVTLKTAGFRQVAIGFGRRIEGIMIRQVAVGIGETGGAGETGETGDSAKTRGVRLDSVWDLQATHGSENARRHYAVDGRFPGKLQERMVENYREISRLWHRFLGGWDGGAEKKAAEENKGGKRRREMEKDENRAAAGRGDGGQRKRARVRVVVSSDEETDEDGESSEG